MAVIDQLVRPAHIYIDKNTTNKSFLDVHYYLKNVGIQNNDFFLCLLDPGLAGVNPRDPNLPASIKARILQECRLNYWYYLREIVLVPSQGGAAGGGDRYQLHRGNLAINFLYTLNYNQYIILPRQCGKSIAACCRYLWCYNFGTTGSEIVFMHKDHNGSKDNLKRVKSIRDALPSYLQLSTSINQEGKKLKVPNTIVMIQNPFNNNKITTYPSARTKDAANNLGRGSTVPLLYFDEFAFMPYNKIVYQAAVPAFSTASQNAKRNNAPYGITITTTPGDLLTDSGQYAYELRNNSTKWIDQYYDYTYEQLEGLRQANTDSPFFLVEYSYKQLGRDQNYFKEMVVNMGKDFVAIRREVMLEWAEIANNCPFTAEELDIIKSHTRQPIRVVPFGRWGQYQFEIYEDIDLQYPPIIGVDVSGATFHDASAITVIDSHTTRVCANMHCNFIPADDLADVLYTLVTKYMPNAIINIERNGGFGIAVVQRLCKTSVKKNLYWELKDKVIEETFNGTRMMRQAKKVRIYGLDSTKAVRARLIEILQERVMYHKDKFVAPILHTEMQSMEVKKSGKVEHSDHSHDDNVFSYLMAMYVWYDGQNLMENFHIRKSTIQTDEDKDVEEVEIENALEKKERLDYDRISAVEDKNNIADELEWMDKAVKGYKTSDTIREQQYFQNLKLRNDLINNSTKLSDSVEIETGINPMVFNAVNTPGFVDLPMSLYDINEDFDTDGTDWNPYDSDSNLNTKKKSTVQGNLSEYFIKL